jgi:DNA-binding transcriptional MerR regulator
VTAGRPRKIGQLARSSGLTVRALHHYDHIGLVQPSARTPSGHRLYDDADIQRLYEVIALRDLGLPLETIGGLLDGQPGLLTLLREHLAHVDDQLRAVRSLRDRLARLIEGAEEADPPTSEDLLDLIDEVNKVDETIKKYFSPDQLDALATRRETVGEQAIRDVQDEWPQLIAKVQAELDAGTDPAEPRVQALAQRWMELLEAFHGGDPELRDSLYRLHEGNSAQIQAEYGGPSPALMDYVGQATQAGAGTS